MSKKTSFILIAIIIILCVTKVTIYKIKEQEAMNFNKLIKTRINSKDLKFQVNAVDVDINNLKVLNLYSIEQYFYCGGIGNQYDYLSSAGKAYIEVLHEKGYKINENDLDVIGWNKVSDNFKLAELKNGVCENYSGDTMDKNGNYSLAYQNEAPTKSEIDSYIEKYGQPTRIEKPDGLWAQTNATMNSTYYYWDVKDTNRNIVQIHFAIVKDGNVTHFDTSNYSVPK